MEVLYQIYNGSATPESEQMYEKDARHSGERLCGHLMGMVMGVISKVVWEKVGCSQTTSS